MSVRGPRPAGSHPWRVLADSHLLNRQRCLLTIWPLDMHDWPTLLSAARRGPNSPLSDWLAIGPPRSSRAAATAESSVVYLGSRGRRGKHDTPPDVQQTAGVAPGSEKPEVGRLSRSRLAE